MAINYFVVPNLKPGTYRFKSFNTGIYPDVRKANLKVVAWPGQIKFVGSLNNIPLEPSLLRKIGNAFSTH